MIHCIIFACTQFDFLYASNIQVNDKDNDVITHYMCPHCSTAYDRWSGEVCKVKAESVKTTKDTNDNL